MWNEVFLSGAQSLLKNGAGFILASRQHAAEKQWQKYNNAMTRLANANNQNNINTNQVLLEERVAAQKFEIERSGYTTAAQAEASAAAAGTGGNSVAMVVFDIERNEANARRNLAKDLEAQYAGLENQRRNSAFQMAQNLDYSYLPKPNPATYALGFVNDTYDAYKRYTDPLKEQ